MIKYETKAESSRLIGIIGYILKYLSVFALIIYCFEIVFGGLSLSLSSSTTADLKIGSGNNSWNKRVGLIPFQISVICALLFATRLFHFFSRGEIFTSKSVRANMSFSIAVLISVVNFWLEGLWIGTAEFVSGYRSDFVININLSEIHFVSMGFALLLLIFAAIQMNAKSQVDELRLIF